MLILLQTEAKEVLGLRFKELSVIRNYLSFPRENESYCLTHCFPLPSLHLTSHLLCFPVSSCYSPPFNFPKQSLDGSQTLTSIQSASITDKPGRSGLGFVAGLLPHALLGDTAVGQQQLLAAWIITATLNLVLFYVMLVFVRREQPGPRRLHSIDASVSKPGTGCTAVVERKLTATDGI